MFDSDPTVKWALQLFAIRVRQVWIRLAVYGITTHHPHLNPFILQGVEFFAYRRKFAFFTVRIRPKIIISAQNDLGKQVK